MYRPMCIYSHLQHTVNSKELPKNPHQPALLMCRTLKILMGAVAVLSMWYMAFLLVSFTVSHRAGRLKRLQEAFIAGSLEGRKGRQH